MGNEHSQQGSCCHLLNCFQRSDDEKRSVRKLLNDNQKKQSIEINQTSEVIEYQFPSSSGPTSEVPSEYHSETEEDPENEGGGGEGGVKKRTEKVKKTRQEAISVNTSSHSGPKWRLIPSSETQTSQNN